MAADGDASAAANLLRRVEAWRISVKDARRAVADFVAELSTARASVSGPQEPSGFLQEVLAANPSARMREAASAPLREPARGASIAERLSAALEDAKSRCSDAEKLCRGAQRVAGTLAREALAGAPGSCAGEAGAGATDDESDQAGAGRARGAEVALVAGGLCRMVGQGQEVVTRVCGELGPGLDGGQMETYLRVWDLDPFWEEGALERLRLLCETPAGVDA